MVILERLVGDHGTLLLDIMGVLIDKSGAIEHAPQFVEYLNESKKPYFILTNICGDTETGIYERLRRNGIPLLSPERVISAGSLVQAYLRDAVPAGATVAFIGPQTCRAVLETGTHPIVACGETDFFDVLALLDDEGFPFRETLEAALTTCVRCFRESGRLPLLLLANSDRAYPRGADSYAFGSGIFATMFDEALKKLVGKSPEVISFGKPSDRMFAEAKRRSGDSSMMMIGDQLATDILGANNFGITSALVLTGINSRQHVTQAATAPNYVIDNLYITGI
ncbi:HAD-IIA family hydrolase [Neorhizobium alkalisoli]|uniref:HAD-IIA family hydrolase n=1 Tax=Neorhizobium alkalisoli TaxID=528178 RepID=UPI000CFA7587|nr:HAD-IIA family hydrolase [Neorhizobium alkalisoli]